MNKREQERGESSLVCWVIGIVGCGIAVVSCLGFLGPALPGGFRGGSFLITDARAAEPPRAKSSSSSPTSKPSGKEASPAKAPASPMEQGRGDGAVVQSSSQEKASASSAPDGYGDLRFGMTRQQVRKLVIQWESKWLESDRALSGAVLSLPDLPAYKGLHGFRVEFDDGLGLYGEREARARGGAALTKIVLEFHSLQRDDLGAVIRAATQKYGKPTATDDESVSIAESGFEFGSSWRLKEGVKNIWWDFQEADLRVTLRLALYTEACTPVLVLEKGSVLREQWTADAHEILRMLEQQGKNQKSQAVLAAFGGGSQSPVAVTTPVPISFLDQSFEVARPAYVVAVGSYKDHALRSVRITVSKSINSIPDGCQFQLNGVIPPRALMTANEHTRSLATGLLWFRRLRSEASPFGNMRIGLGAGKVMCSDVLIPLAASLDLGPDVVVLTTNYIPQQYDFSEIVAMRSRCERMGVKVHIFFWLLPDNPERASYDGVEPHDYPSLSVPATWKEFAERTGGTCTLVQYHEVFWGQGPVVDLRWDEPRYHRPITRKGVIIYADEDEYVLREHYDNNNYEHWLIPRDKIHGLTVVQQMSSPGWYPQQARDLLPKGSVGQDSAHDARVDGVVQGLKLKQ